MIHPDYREFSRLARQSTLVPVVKSITADLLTPVSAFLAIAAREPNAFLLESVERGEQIGRYTFLERSRTCGWKRMGVKLGSTAASAKSSAKAAHCKPQKNCFDSTVPQPCPDCRHSPLARSAIAATISCGSWKVLASILKMIFLFPIACSCSSIGCWRSII